MTEVKGTELDLVICNQGTTEAGVELEPTVIHESPKHGNEVASPVKPPFVVQLMMVMFGLFCLLGYNFFYQQHCVFQTKV